LSDREAVVAICSDMPARGMIVVEPRAFVEVANTFLALNLIAIARTWFSVPREPLLERHLRCTRRRGLCEHLGQGGCS
jgi:hypothetical protein